MKETAAALILACLMVLGVVCVLPVNAQPYQGGITISADGSVTSSTAPIQQEGDTYTLTSDVEGSIAVGRNDTVLDGNGHTITGGKSSIAIDLYGVSNDTVKNFVITGGTFGIAFSGTSCVIANNTITGIGISLLSLTYYTAAIYVYGGSSNSIINNSMTNNVRDISLTETNNNFIVGNSIADENDFYGASNNTIYHNNFVRGNQNYIDSSVPSSGNVWDAGYPLGGNYWSNYLTRYPNASEIDSSGIGDTAYVSRWLWGDQVIRSTTDTRSWSLSTARLVRFRLLRREYPLGRR